MHSWRLVLWLLWIGNGVIIGIVWFATDGVTFLDSPAPLISLGRLFGLLTAYSVLVQLVVMARARWIEGVFGLDRIALFHRLNGYAVFYLLLLHAGSMIIGNTLLREQNIFATVAAFAGTSELLLALLAASLLIIIVALSIYIVRRHLKFETWYYVHLLTYLAVALAAFHQFALGTTLNSYLVFWWYWVALYAVTIILVLWRFIRPLYLELRFGFRVERVSPEAERATSVYITGRHLRHFHAKAGQFIMVRFLTRGMWWQEHPFSLSKLPNDKHLRITVRQLGDFTNDIPSLSPGTPVLISGPHGAYTHERAAQDKLLYIAGGIGITPIRSLVEDQTLHKTPKDAILLYANRRHDDTALREELDELAAELAMPVHYIYETPPTVNAETGYVDLGKIQRLVPDAAERAVFLCGPPKMMESVNDALQQHGVPKQNIHTESFSLHIK